MKPTKLVLFTLGALIVTFGGASSFAQKTTPASGTPVKMVVTVEARHGTDVPMVHREDVVVKQDQKRIHATDWIPLQGEHAGMDLYILLDDGSDTYLSLQFEDLRKFIHSQPPTTKIAVGYMRNGAVNMVQNLTAEHDAAGKALRMPSGTSGNSPYFSLMDLMKRLPHDQERLEILMVSDGVDPGEGIVDPYVDSVIEQALRNKILIYTIYASGVGHQRTTLGQNNLSRLASETGGEAYFQGFHTPISFAPFLADFATQLSHQYLLTFNAQPEKDSFQRVDLDTEVPNAQLITADKVYVPAGRP